MIPQVLDRGAELFRALGDFFGHRLEPLDLLEDRALDLIDHVGFQAPVLQQVENIGNTPLQAAFGFALLFCVLVQREALFTMGPGLLVDRFDLADGLQKLSGLRHLVDVRVALVDVAENVLRA